MDSSMVTAGAAMLGSLTGEAASILTTWITQRTQAVRSQIEARLRERETLYGEFITEASRLTLEALSHSLEQPETFVKLSISPNRSSRSWSARVQHVTGVKSLVACSASTAGTPS
jgi:hypothetical protein